MKRGKRQEIKYRSRKFKPPIPRQVAADGLDPVLSSTRECATMMVPAGDVLVAKAHLNWKIAYFRNPQGCCGPPSSPYTPRSFQPRTPRPPGWSRGSQWQCFVFATLDQALSRRTECATMLLPTNKIRCATVFTNVGVVFRIAIRPVV